MAEPPEAVKIIDLDENNKLILHKDTLEKILLCEPIKDKKVCVISIAGAFRQGKSFLLNFLIRYLNMKYKQKVKVKKWLEGSANETVAGFSWESGSKRHTTGILMWSEVFSAQLDPSGEEVAIILLDTQGSFDTTTTVRECATIFALSTLISSTQIYNLKENIKQDDLSHLEYFVNYGQMVLENSKYEGPPFQNLLFLIRDWPWPSEHTYGSEGGKELLNDVLNTDAESVVLPDEILAQRKNIKKMFENISCFLLPHPGEAVVTDEKFNGELDKVAPIFKQHVEVLGPFILKRVNLIPKTVNGNKITVGDLVSMIETYWDCFQSGRMPELPTLLSSTSILQHMLSVNQAEGEYDALMKSKMKEVEEAFSDEDLQNVHEESKNHALNHYRNAKKMGNENMNNQYELKLEENLERKFLEYKENNTLKREAQQTLRNWVKYVFSNKLVNLPVWSTVTAATAYIAGYVTYTSASAVAAAGIITADVICTTVVSATAGAVAGYFLIAPTVLIGLAIAGWKWWRKE